MPKIKTKGWSIEEVLAIRDLLNVVERSFNPLSNDYEGRMVQAALIKIHEKLRIKAAMGINPENEKGITISFDSVEVFAMLALQGTLEFWSKEFGGSLDSIISRLYSPLHQKTA